MKVIENWTNEITEIENWFSKIDIKGKQVNLSPAELIVDCEIFVTGHIGMVKEHNGKPNYKPYLERLQLFKNLKIWNTQ